MGNKELELKLEVGADDIRRLSRRAAFRRLSAGKKTYRQLRSIYFDTPDLRLHREKASLRVRKDGERWVQTLKRGTSLEHGLSNPIEIEYELTGPKLDISRIDDPVLKPWLCELVGDQPLQPVFETNMKRATSLLTVDGSGTVEVAIDQGAVQNQERRQPFNEIELELKSGDPHTLLTISEALFAPDSITPSDRSKAERGYALLRQDGDLRPQQPKPHGYSRPDLTPQIPVEQALKMIGRAAARQILGNWQALLTSDEPEVPHQLRIGLRRLRTALKIFQSSTDIDSLRPISAMARDLGRIVGELRNADVLLNDIVTPALAELGIKKRHAALIDFLEQDRVRQRETVRRALRDKHWTPLKLNCMLFDQAVDRAIIGRALPDQVMRMSSLELDRAWRKARNRGRGFARLKISERHELRKALKELRYTFDPFLALYKTEAAKEFLNDLKRLQDVFGYLNDVAMAESLEDTIARNHPQRKDLNKAVAEICKWHRKRAKAAMKKADTRWHKLVDDQKFWREAAA